MKSLLNDAQRLLAEYRAQQEARFGDSLILPLAAREELLSAVSANVVAELRQFQPVLTEDGETDDFQSLILRQMARSGIRVERLYYLPYHGYAKHFIERQISADIEASIQSRIIVATELTRKALVYDEHWLMLLDGKTLLRAIGTSKEDIPDAILISESQSEFTSADQMWKQIWATAHSKTETSDCLDLGEPLATSADILAEVAPTLCTGDHIDGEDCSWYHGVWQYLRLVDMVSTPTWHHDFYLKALKDAYKLHPGAPILISGTADYSLLAYVITAAVDRKEASIEVIDQCATPLFACNWFAKRQERPISVIQHDLLNWTPPRNYGIICSDAFLTRFGALRSLDVLDKWHSILVPGGIVITTIRLHARSQIGRDAEKAVVDFRDRAVQRIKKWRPFLRLTTVSFGDKAEEYARRMKSLPIGEEADVLHIVARAGFTVLLKEVAPVPGELYPTQYMRIVMQRN